MLENVSFETGIVKATLDHYRLDWTPAPAVEQCGMWISGLVSDADGKDYLGLRGWNDFITGATHTQTPACGFRALEKTLQGDPPHLFPEFATHDWFEPVQYAATDTEITLTHGTGRVVRDADGLHWFDADGRWELHGRPLSDMFVVHVPRQPGIEHEVYYRHELIKAHGAINGTSVEGHLHQDYCYGPPGLRYTELPIARQLEGIWMSWVHEYADGEVGGGCFWQGRGGLEFGPGYLVVDGRTSHHGDFRADVNLIDGFRPSTMHVDVGDRWFDFAFDSVSGPLHTVGRLTKSSGGKEPVRSWCWIEYADGIMGPEILDLVGEHFRLAWAR